MGPQSRNSTSACGAFCGSVGGGAHDEIGLELDSIEQAYVEAFATALSMWPELLAARCNPLDRSFEVTDASDKLLFRLPFSELVDACRPLRAPGPDSELRQSIDATYLRAQTAREDIRFGFDQVRQALQEANDLLGRLARFERGAPAP
jgi:hypothetical protein